MMMIHSPWIAIVSTLLVVGMASAAHDDITTMTRTTTTTTSDSRHGVPMHNDDYDGAQKCNDMEWKLINDIIMASATIETPPSEPEVVVETDTTPIPPPQTTTTIAEIPSPPNRRFLRTKEERDLQYRCRNRCAGFAIGSCPVPGCKGYKPSTKRNGSKRARNLEQHMTMMIKVIQTPCTDAQTKYVHHKLIHLIRTHAVSLPCQDWLKDSRHITCQRRHSQVDDVATARDNMIV